MPVDIRMFPLIVCYCGRSLGEVYPVFIKMRAEHIEKYIAENKLNIAPSNWYNSNLNIDISAIFDLIGLENTCCREKINTNLLFKQYY